MSASGCTGSVSRYYCDGMRDSTGGVHACTRSMPGYISRESKTTRNVLWSRASVCLSVCLSAAACRHYCTDPDVTWGSGRGCPLVVHYWADLQLVHRLRCYGNITRTRNVSEYMLVLSA